MTGSNMIRKLLATALIVVALGAAPLHAETMQESLVAQLGAQGFTQIRISRTFLGRVRIEATSPEYVREIIFNPRTNEILRDYWNELGDEAASSGTRIADPARGSGPKSSPRAGSDDKGDDDKGDGKGSGKGDDDRDHGSKDDGKDDRKDDRKDDGHHGGEDD